MKVMTAMYTIRRGGAYDRFIMMLEAFLERECTVHCLSLTPIEIEHPCYRNHVLILPFKIGNGFATKLTVLLFFPLYSLLVGWRERIDFFVAFGPLYAFIQAIPKLILGRPMITLVRLEPSFGLRIEDSSRFNLRLNGVMEYIGLFFSDKVVTVNRDMRDSIIRAIGKWKKIEVEVLFNNIPPIPSVEAEDFCQARTQLGIPKEAKVLVTVGVLNRRKNIEILLKCFPEVQIQDLFLLIVGDASLNSDFWYKNHLKELIKTLGLGKRVIFTGWVEKEELWKIYLASDLFVMPSINEGMPNALLEALGVGLPCMGSNIPGIKDILHYEDLMFDPLEKESLLQKIQGFFSDRQFFDKVKRLCQERKDVFVFDWEERVFEMITGAPTSLIK